MKKEEFAQSLLDLASIEDAAERRVKITELTDVANAIFDDQEKLTQANSKFEADNKKLQEYNMQLFLRVGDKKQPKEPEEQPQGEPLKYENLFNEKGELK